MDPRLQAWLLRGDPLPEGADLDALVTAALPAPPPPPSLFADTLARVRHEMTASEASLRAQPPPALADGIQIPAPANRPRWAMRAVGIAGALLAAAAALFVVIPDPDPIGDPTTFVPRGSDELLPGVSLEMAVKTGASIDRLHRGAFYDAGDTLLFRYTAERLGVVHLVRVDDHGAKLLHVERAGPGTADLLTDGLPLGYELEVGEGAAVFALLVAESEIDPYAVTSTLAVGADVERVCVAARTLGAGCSAELVGGVR
jgi:hypothetical protein